MWASLAVIVLPVVLLLTRSSLVYDHFWNRVINRLPVSVAHFIFEFSSCPMCVGFWVTALPAILLHVPLLHAALAYLVVVFACRIYDYLEPRSL